MTLFPALDLGLRRFGLARHGAAIVGWAIAGAVIAGLVAWSVAMAERESRAHTVAQAAW